MLRMTVREGGTVRTVRLEGSRAEIGSGPAATVRVAGAGVSARHCVIRGLRRGFEVLDQASREGTILNGTRVSRAALRPGDVLTVGSSSLVLEECSLGPGAPGGLPGPAAGVRLPVALVARSGGPAPPDPFEIQLYRAVRKSPPVLASVGIHGIAALLALVLVPEGLAAPPGAVAVAVLRETPIDVERDPERDSLDAAALPVERLPLPQPDPPAPEEERPADREPPPSMDPPAETRGGEIPESAIAVPGIRRNPQEKAVDFEGNPAFSGEGAGAANRAAAGLVLEGLGGKGTGDRALLGRLDARRILVVRGTYDRVEDTLALLGIRHDTLKPEEISVAPLPPEAILIIDCDADPVDDAGARAIRNFVASGGYLCTTDWGLEHVIERSFPGVLRSLARGGMGVSTQNEVVSMRVTAPNHPLVRGIRGITEDATWWVEDQAHPVEVLDRARVTVLAESPEFRRRYRSGVLAATFGHGKGKVLHLLGHAWQKEGNLKGTYALQRMLLNFLIDRAGTAGD